jgi:hypothetical protein
MKKSLTALLLMGAFLSVNAAHAADADSTPKHKTTKKAASHKAAHHSAKKTAKTEKAAAAPAAINDEDDRPSDIAGATGVDYDCALGDKVSIYSKADDDKHIELRWKSKLHHLSKVDTTTGAHRFENRRQGLVWIGIPAKGILLDSKKGEQLANDCKSPDQLKGTSATTAPAPGSTLITQ